jgi:PPOX class probable F420-dependent enzyme
LTVQDHDSDIPEGYGDLLESTALAHVATIGPHGEPQNNPVWFDWDGEHVKFSQTKARQKLRNLNRDPRIAFSIVDPENPYRYLEVRGEVARVEEDPNIDFISAMAKKYMGVDRYPYHRDGDERVVVFVKPRHTTQMGA